MTALYEFRSVSFSTPAQNSSAGVVNIIINASFEIVRGAFTVISGPSGAGKTTLLRLFNRLADQSSGDIFFDGKGIRDYPVTELRRRIGWVPQVPVSFAGTVEDNLRLPFIVSKSVKYSRDEISRSIDELKSLNLLPVGIFGRRAVDLSVGEAQRLNLLRAIALKPDVLLLDEPTSALDSTASDILLAHIKQIQAQQNLTTIMVSHRPDEINRVGNFLLTINEGSIRIGKISGDLNE
jgi:ABC-type methionine transport system ATPase subunit